MNLSDYEEVHTWDHLPELRFNMVDGIPVEVPFAPGYFEAEYSAVIFKHRETGEPICVFFPRDKEKRRDRRFIL